jgi:6-phosphogluconolactonase
VVNEIFFSKQDDLQADLLKDAYTILKDATENHRSASFLVSGGSSPQQFYQGLSKQFLPWSQIDVALVDERWVEPEEKGSNETFIAKNLLINEASSARFIAMKTAEKTAVQGRSNCERRYQQLTQPFDLVVLGMGADGHTASLFPYADGLIDAFDTSKQQLCAAINAKQSPVTGTLTERMSLSLFGLLQAKQIFLLITGSEKLEVYQKALKNTDTALMPISAVLQQSVVPVSVYWAP